MRKVRKFYIVYAEGEEIARFRSFEYANFFINHYFDVHLRNKMVMKEKVWNT